MVDKIGRAHRVRGLALVAATAMLVTSGTAFAQLAPMNGGPSSSLGVPGNSAPVGGTGIPFGATSLGTAGLSPPPLGATTGLAPSASGMTSGLGTAGLGVAGMAMSGSAGSTSSFGNGLSPGVMPPGNPAPLPGMATQVPGRFN